MTDLKLLEKNYPNLLPELEKENEDCLAPEDLEIEESASGPAIIKIRGLYVHSPRDPVREAQRQIQSLVSGNKGEGPIIVLGFGFGYAAMAAAEAAPERLIIIVEKRREIFKFALEKRDLGPFLFSNKIVFILGDMGLEISSALTMIGNNKGSPLIIKNRTLTNLDAEWYREVEKSIHGWVSRYDINRATIRRFGHRWVRNLSINLAAIRDMPGIIMLQDLIKEKNIPVFLAAAGPTLDTIRPMIPEIAKRCVIVAVDTSLRFILEAGIEPDFVVSLDPQYWNFRHLDRTIAPNTCLIAESAVYPACLRHPFKQVFLGGSMFPLGRFIEDRVDPKGEIGIGGSVATAAWDFSRILGASTIWIAGLDLSFPKLKTHFHGALFEEKSHAQSFRFAPGETISTKTLRDGGLFYAKNIMGNQVLTDQRLSLYAAWFENRFSQYPEIKNLSFSREGLAVKGLEIGREEELLALPECRGQINSLLENVLLKIKNEFSKDEFNPEISANTKTKAGNRALIYGKTVKTLFSGLEEVKNTAEEAYKYAEIWKIRFENRHFERGDEEKVLKKLDVANKSITQSSVKDIVDFLLPDVAELEKNLKVNYPSLMQKHLDFSINFYKALAEAARFNLKTLKTQTKI